MTLVSIRYCRRSKTVFAVVILFGIARKVSPSSGDVPVQPSFSEPIPNVTVSAGRDVSLPCVIENLGSYRMAWTHRDKNTLLSIQTRVIIRNSRYKVTHSNHRTWYLHISEVNEKDSGQYMCQINTSPMISQTGYVEVVVPPYIDEEATSSDTDVREGNDANLKCVAKGSPNPEIKWRREDGGDIVLGRERVHTTHGNSLNLTKLSRLHMGAYLCIASNGILPSVSKRILLKVNFPPMVWIPNQLVGAPVGSEVTLDCNLESHPQSVTFWTREGGTIILSGANYDSVLMPSGNYKVQMRLRIRVVRHSDFGSYTCVAKNSLGETEGTIRLYEIPPPSTVAPPEGAATSRARSEKLRNGYHFPAQDTETDESSYSDVHRNVETNLDEKNLIEKGSMETEGHSRSSRIHPDPAILSTTLCALICILCGILDRRR